MRAASGSDIWFGDLAFALGCCHAGGAASFPSLPLFKRRIQRQQQRQQRGPQQGPERGPEQGPQDLPNSSGERSQPHGELPAISTIAPVMHFQPQICALTGKVRAAQAQLRLVDASGRCFGAEQFMPLYRRAGKIKDLDLWTLSQARRTLERWRACGLGDMELALTVSLESVIDAEWLGDAGFAAAAAHGRLLFEINQTVLLGEGGSARQALDRLLSAGARVYIGGFDTGVDGGVDGVVDGGDPLLNVLQRFLVDGVTIGHRVSAELGGERGRKLMASLIDLARSADLGITVEGVDNAWQLPHMPRHPKSLLQGEYFSPAVNELAFREFVAGRRSVQAAAPTEPSTNSRNGVQGSADELTQDSGD